MIWSIADDDLGPGDYEVNIGWLLMVTQQGRTDADTGCVAQS